MGRPESGPGTQNSLRVKLVDHLLVDRQRCLGGELYVSSDDRVVRQQAEQRQATFRTELILGPDSSGAASAAVASVSMRSGDEPSSPPQIERPSSLRACRPDSFDDRLHQRRTY